MQTIDHATLSTALAESQRSLHRLTWFVDDPSLAGLEATWKEVFQKGQRLPPLECVKRAAAKHPVYGFATACLLKALLSSHNLQTTLTAGNHNEPILQTADVALSDDAVLHGVMVVMGDLTVDGILRCEQGSLLIVTGTLRAKHIDLYGQAVVGNLLSEGVLYGEVVAPSRPPKSRGLASLRAAQTLGGLSSAATYGDNKLAAGALYVIDRLLARLVVSDDFEIAFDHLDTEHYTEDVSKKTLLRMLRKEVFSDYGGPSCSLVHKRLFARIEKGAEVFLYPSKRELPQNLSAPIVVRLPEEMVKRALQEPATPTKAHEEEEPPVEESTKEIGHGRVNTVMLLGELEEEPELHFPGPEQAVALLRVVTYEEYIDKLGKAIRRPERHEVVAWDALAHYAQKSLRRGDHLWVEGHLVSVTTIQKKEKQKRVQVLAKSLSRL